MSDAPADAISALLVRAERAHGTYETTVLHGVYDQDWGRWYAAYAVEHGIAGLLGREVTVDALAAFLATSNLEFQQAEPKPIDDWADWTARRIAADL